jgi:hypothetical protein
MMPSSEPSADVRSEIAVAAARLIADEGCDYATARRRAARDVIGAGRELRSLMPDHAQIESALRTHLRIFAGERQPQLLAALRQLAVQVMARLAQFNPHLSGAVLNGTATEHSDLNLLLFTDSAKEVEMFLLDEGVEFDVFEGPQGPAGAEETVHFVVQPARSSGMPLRVGVNLAILPVDAIRVAARQRSLEPGLHPIEQSGRASLAALRVLLAQQAQPVAPAQPLAQPQAHGQQR